MRKHKWIATGIQHLAWTRGLPETLVLWRCECGCGKTDTERIQGTWTAAQLGLTLEVN